MAFELMQPGDLGPALAIFRSYKQRPYTADSQFTCHSIEHRPYLLGLGISDASVWRIKEEYRRFCHKDGKPAWWSSGLLCINERTQALQDFLTFLESQA